MNVFGRFFALAACTALAVNAAPLGAQSVSQNESTPTAAVVAPVAQTDSAVEARGPRLAAARVAVHAESTPIGAPPVIQNRRSNRNSVALMAVSSLDDALRSVLRHDAGCDCPFPIALAPAAIALTMLW